VFMQLQQKEHDALAASVIRHGGLDVHKLYWWFDLAGRYLQLAAALWLPMDTRCIVAAISDQTPLQPEAIPLRRGAGRLLTA